MPPTSICLMVVNCAYVFLWPSWEGIMFNPPWSCWFHGVYVCCLVQALFTTPCSTCENVIGIGSCSTNHSNLHVLHSKSRINLCVSRGSNRYMWILLFGRRYWKPFGLPTCLWLKQLLMWVAQIILKGVRPQNWLPHACSMHHPNVALDICSSLGI